MSSLWVSLFLVLVLFQNCGSDVDFSKDVNSSGTGSEAVAAINGQLDGDENSDVDVINENCESNNPIVKTIKLKFPKPNKTCDWSADGNLSELNQYFRARIEQKKNLNLPPGAIICDAEFNFKQQDFLYDDHFLLLFNKSVIAASYDFKNKLQSKNFGLLEYKWDSMAGMFWDGSKETIFCPQIPGFGSNCSFPGHDLQGFINLDYDSFYVRGIMSNGIPENHSFTMVSIGDNDQYDCEHSDVEFDVKVTYVK